MGWLYFDSTYFIYIVPAIIITMLAQFSVNSTFAKYSKIYNQRHITGSDAAKIVLRSNMVTDVSVVPISGSMTDHYDPRNNTIALSEPVINNSTIAAVGVAAHEAGHALQHNKGYFPMKVRSAIIPVTNFGTKLALPLIIIGLLLPVQYSYVSTLGILFYSLSFIFQLVTLPVEFNASRRAIQNLSRENVLTQEELAGAKKVLTAAALTYLAAAFASLLSLLRIIAIVNRRDRR